MQKHPDHLVGLKENVIIGKLIPAGSGLMAYRDDQPGITPDEEVVEEDEAIDEIVETEEVDEEAI